MNDVLEIRSSPQEIKRSVLLDSRWFLIWTLVHFSGGQLPKEKFLFFFLGYCIFVAGDWFYWQRKYLCLDSVGVTYNNGFFTKRVLWRDVDAFRAEWYHDSSTPKSLSFLSYADYSIVTLRDKQGDKLMRITIDFGTKEERDACRQFFKTSRESSAAPMTTI